MEVPRVTGLFLTREKGAVPESVKSVKASVTGLEGDHHGGRNSKRQILIQSESILNELGLQRGELYENMLVKDLNVMDLPEGQHLQIGEVLIEITIPCEPCWKMERVRSGLALAITGKRGKFAQVVTPGELRVGDKIRPVQALVE